MKGAHSNIRHTGARFYSASDFYRNRFGTKVYKIALDAGCTCPTRDGTKGSRGCIFCSGSGSGDFAVPLMESAAVSDNAVNSVLDIKTQFMQAKKLVESKVRGRSGKTAGKYIVYFQNYTNTYGNPDKLEQLWRESIVQDDVVGIAIATRPDCLDDGILARIAKMAEETFVSIELGLQTVSEKSAMYIRRGYLLLVYDDAVRRIRKANPAIHIVTHVIFGIPGETEFNMLATVRHCAGNKHNCSTIEEHSGSQLLEEHSAPPAVDGIKISLLHVLKGTDLANDWAANKVRCLTMDEYFSLIAKSISILPPDMVIHRLTGDGSKKLLLAPLWTADKKKVHNALKKYLEMHEIIQGSVK